LRARDGVRLNHKRLFRLYREEEPGARKRGGGKRALGTRSPMALPEAANQRWSLDFISDTLSNGYRFRILAVVDEFTRECLDLVADTSLSGLQRVSRPVTMVSDNGTKLTSHAVLRWQEERGVLWHYIAPGGAAQGSSGAADGMAAERSRSRTVSWKASTAGSGTNT